jgi:quercetin dioxygenase-like cupin family protein
MTRAGDFFENPVTGERVLVRVGGADTHGRYLSVDAWVGPRSVAHEHVHPHSRERFTVLNGWVRVLVDGEERDVRAGETVEFAPGVSHDYWNPGAREAHVLVEVWDAERFEEMMVTLFALAQEGKVTDEGVPTLLQSAVLAREYRDVVVFGGVLQRSVYAALSPFARLRGLKPTYAHHGALALDEQSGREPLPELGAELAPELAPAYGVAA